MDKQEYISKLEQINALAEQGNFREASEVADEIDWRHVKSVRTLSMIGEIYEANKRYEESLRIMKYAYRRSSSSKTVLYRICELSIKTRDFDEAKKYLNEFEQNSPNDTSRYILKYKLLRAEKAPLDDQIQVLRDYKDHEYTERWAFELAKLYRKNGQKEKCLEECDDMILWFSEGRYVTKAMEMKLQMDHLTPSQQIKYDAAVKRTAEEKANIIKPEETEDAEQLLNGMETVEKAVDSADDEEDEKPQMSAEEAISKMEEAAVSTIGDKSVADLQAAHSGDKKNGSEKLQNRLLGSIKAVFSGIRPTDDAEDEDSDMKIAGEPGTKPLETPIDFDTVKELETAMEAVDLMDQQEEEADEEETEEANTEEAAENFAAEEVAPLEEQVEVEPDINALDDVKELEPESISAAGVVVRQLSRVFGRRDKKKSVEEKHSEAIDKALQDEKPEALDLDKLFAETAGDLATEVASGNFEMTDVVEGEAHEATDAVDEAIEAMKEASEAVADETAEVVEDEVDEEVTETEDEVDEEVTETEDEAAATVDEVAAEIAAMEAEAERVREIAEEAAEPTVTEEAENAVRSAFEAAAEEEEDDFLAGYDADDMPVEELPYEADEEDEVPAAETAAESEVVEETVAVEEVEEAEETEEVEGTEEAEETEAVEDADEVEETEAVEATEEAEEEEASEDETVLDRETDESLGLTREFHFQEEIEKVLAARRAKKAADDAVTENAPIRSPEEAASENVAQAVSEILEREEAPAPAVEAEEIPEATEVPPLEDEVVPMAPVFAEEDESEEAETEEELLEEYGSEDDEDVLPEEESSEKLMNLISDPQPINLGIDHEADPDFLERVPVEGRKFSSAEAKAFSYFATIPGIDYQATSAIADVHNSSGDKTSKGGNIVIMGRPGSGKTKLADALILSICLDLDIKAAKVGKLVSDAFNQKDPAAVVKKLAGGFLVIEAAGALSDAAVERLNKAMDFRTDDLIVILEDEKQDIQKLFSNHPDFAQKFTSRITVPVFTNDELVSFGKVYAKENGYKMDEMATLALYTMIGDNQKEAEPVTVGRVREMIDKAADRNSRKFRFGKGTDREDGMIVLHEKDFNF